ncbi:hypothetical protein BDV95DRAFT_561166 [Massariosphaeria phaeospora]|uniref:Cora-domain-containing protein n=1 Tax=Massariosphaeria phaeospora TaxID=100035 RepID=A0A7C8MER1_9PLEO|nr:hypothetical protein BDV95DRAFT_561166 [Massariosphaeria phaeospora]
MASPARRGDPSSTSAMAPSTFAQAAAPESQPAASSSAPAKKRKHRGGKKRRNRRQSFAATADTDMADESRPSLVNVAGQAHSHSRASSSFYQLQNRSNTSLESEALLDHRDQAQFQPRRGSVQQAQMFQQRPSQPFGRSKLSYQQRQADGEHHDDDDDDDADERTGLMGASYHSDLRTANYGGTSIPSNAGRAATQRVAGFSQHHGQNNLGDYDVNNPPSVPASPVLGPSGFDVMIPTDVGHSHSPEGGKSPSRSHDALIDIDKEREEQEHSERESFDHGSGSSPCPGDFHRRMTAAEDVCFPLEGMSELGQEDYAHRPEIGDPQARRRRRRWPDLGVLDAWSREEKEQRTMDGMRMRKVSEPLMVEGRLRPQKRAWHREADDAPYRFTYFNEEFDNTIHSQTISELVQPGQTFRNLFIPDPPVIEDTSDSETDEDELPSREPTTDRVSVNGHARSDTQASSRVEARHVSSGEHTRSSTPKPPPTPKPAQEKPQEKPRRYGPRPAFWLDVLSPTDTEMKVISKAFGIHPLTAEDILMQEQREKVELFKHYYFINYRTFEQDENSEDYLEPVNLYVVVFREGVISFHFSMCPHPANVRRRIRQLQDYLILSPDWISYGIIDDITDAYAPLIQRIEEEVDEIDEAILRLHSVEEEQEAKKAKSYSYNNPHYEKEPETSRDTQDGGRDMLRRVGECRKKVMSLYRLLGNKADVIKGFAKRCNEQWDVAPRSEIGLYLGDIQDHIVTMTGNLSHYENLLSRAHSNYLAQINIRMNERQEKTSDILGKLTVLGTIVLPMNVVTGIWGMNCLVPGQDIENLNWFWCITSGLLIFGLLCYIIAKRVYGIV